MGLSLFAPTAQHQLSVWLEEKEVRAWVVASLEVVVVVEAVEVVVVVVAEVVLDGRLVTPLMKTLMRTLTKTMAGAIEGAMAGTMTMTLAMTTTLTMTLAMTMTMIMTMVMTMTMTIDLDVVDVVEGVVLEGLLMDVAVMGLDHRAWTTRGQTPVLMAPHQPGSQFARLEDGHDTPTTRGPHALTAPDLTTASAKTQAHPLALMEQSLFALMVALLLQGQSVQTTTLMWSFSGLKGETPYKSRNY